VFSLVFYTRVSLCAAMMRSTAIATAILTTVFASPVDNRNANYLAHRDTSFWYANLDHTGPYRGYAPDLDGNSSTYPVYQAVSPGASAADIQAAINDDGNGGSRHSEWLASQPRVVYIPPGTYEIDETIYFNTDTILMGDATDPPILKAVAGGFTADQTLVSGQDPGTGASGELSFAVGLKNIVLDTSAIDGGTYRAFLPAISTDLARNGLYCPLVGSRPGRSAAERQNYHGLFC
jgi:hypothetical protein